MKRQLLIVLGVAALCLIGLVVALVVMSDPDEPAAALLTIVHTTFPYDIERDADVPLLPFADNPDPSQCGIPVQWGKDGQAWLSGVWDSELVQPTVFLYESHLRTSIIGRAPHGSEVEIVLFQENPVVDYYFVKVPGDVPQEGWVPEPFLSFDPVT